MVARGQDDGVVAERKNVKSLANSNRHIKTKVRLLFRNMFVNHLLAIREGE